jgi:hypothetical protein
MWKVIIKLLIEGAQREVTGRIHLTEDTVQWRAVVNAIMIARVR